MPKASTEYAYDFMGSRCTCQDSDLDFCQYCRLVRIMKKQAAAIDDEYGQKFRAMSTQIAGLEDEVQAAHNLIVQGCHDLVKYLCGQCHQVVQKVALFRRSADIQENDWSVRFKI